ncbi:MAG: LacI family DNA-binding transcriptional regulator [Lachnospiraceae bacterium]|nr:LacI family DNA-binding transcriptional regulator [Lachnospiraceae bacterium]
MVTLKEVAAASGVSPATVSNILNGKSKAGEETTRRVLETVEKLGYYPNYMAKGLRTQRTNTVAIIAEDINQFTTPEVIGSIMAGLEAHGYRTVLQNLRLYERWQDTWYDSDNALSSMLNPALQECKAINVDGIIYVAGHARKIHCIPDDLDIPVVMTYAYSTSEHIPSVVIDDEQGAYEVMKYLLEKGHRRIAIITGRGDNIHTQLRMKGVTRAMYEYNCAFNPYLVTEGNWNRADAYPGLERLRIAEQGVTAVFSMNDEMAAAAYDVIEEAGLRVGEDISVVGFDNASIAQYFRPGLTTMELPLRQMGWKAAELLVDILADERRANSEVHAFPCTFVERKSVKDISD